MAADTNGHAEAALLQRRYQGYSAKQISTILIKKLHKGLNIRLDCPSQETKRQLAFIRVQNDRNKGSEGVHPDALNHVNNKALHKMPEENIIILTRTTIKYTHYYLIE